jgi:hypothetical protein
MFFRTETVTTFNGRRDKDFGGREVMKQEENRGEIVIYKNKEGGSGLQVYLKADTVWLSQKMM